MLLGCKPLGESLEAWSYLFRKMERSLHEKGAEPGEKVSLRKRGEREKSEKIKLGK